MKVKLREIQNARSSAQNEELLELKRQSDRQIQRLTQELEAMRNREENAYREVDHLKKDNEKALFLLDSMKKES